MGDLHRRHPPQDIYPREPWRLVETHFDERYLAAAESLFATANGYLGMRGTCDEGQPVVHNGTYINGFHETWPIVYGEEAYGFAKLGQTIVDVPDAKIIRLYVDDEPFFLPTGTLEGFERALDMRAGTLDRELVWAHSSGQRVSIRSRRLVSLEHRHLAAIEYEVTLLANRRARRGRVGSGRQQYPAFQWGPPHAAVRLRSARHGGEPYRGRARGPWTRDQVERDDPVVRHRSRRADGLFVQRESIGRRVRRARGLFHRRHGGDPDSAHQVHHVPLVAPPPGRGALPTCRAGPRSGGGEGVRGSARQPEALSRRLLGLQRRGGARQSRVAADDPVQPVPHVPGDGAGRGSRRAGQGTDRTRVRGALLLGHRDIRAALPHVYETADRAEPAPSATRLSGRGARARPGGQSARGAVSVAHHQRQRGVRVLRGGDGAIPHQRGHRVRASQVRRRHRGQGLSRGRGRGNSWSKRPACGSTSASSAATTASSGSTG